MKASKNKKAVDFTLLLSFIILITIGIVMVFSSSWPEAMVKQKDGFFFLKRHLRYVAIGTVIMLATMNLDYKIYKKFAFPIYLFSIFTGLLLFTDLGIEHNGAIRWLNLKIITIMPSDIIKLGSIIFLAAFLSNKRDRIKSFSYGSLPTLILIGISSGIVVSQDLGTAFTIAITMLAMFFVGGANFFHLTGLFGLSVGALWYIVHDESQPYRLKRITSFLDPFADKLDGGWQVVQSIYALASGGLFGLGLGKSRQKYFYISEAYNDFIFAIIGEELGLIGALLVIITFIIVIWKGVSIAISCEDKFGSYLATGISALIAIQSLVHIGVVTASIPTTGITLPFISYGGTSLTIYMAMAGILLNISRHIDDGRT